MTAKVRIKPRKLGGLPLAKTRIRHFKAIRDSGPIAFTPLTAFIGNNGVGKSSVIEALEAYQKLALVGIYAATERWRGFEHIWNKASDHAAEENQVGRIECSNPMRFWGSGHTPAGYFEAAVELNTDPKSKEVYFSRYETATKGEDGEKQRIRTDDEKLREGGRIADPALAAFVLGWMFLDLTPGSMLYPRLRAHTDVMRGYLESLRAYETRAALAKDGSNLADYLLDFTAQDPAGFDGLVDTLRTVLPYTEDLRASITSELERSTYVSLKEKGINERIYGWLLSQGTLRITALLAVLRHPKPPSVLFVEELENGLDPRTLHLVVEEIRQFIESGRGQVVITTHSPYLLDLLHLSQILVVERDKKGAPSFRRPDSDKELKAWAKDFAPGQLYTMGKLSREENA
jgi:predicted ATPase